jgi:hypothetical protein
MSDDYEENGGHAHHRVCQFESCFFCFSTMLSVVSSSRRSSPIHSIFTPSELAIENQWLRHLFLFLAEMGLRALHEKSDETKIVSQRRKC